jgi:hypothetical protein
VTELCKTIIKAISLINAVGGRSTTVRKKADAGKFTVLHFTDVFKGCEHKKIVEYGE